MFDKKIDRASFKNELKFQTEKLYMHSSVTYDDKNILEIGNFIYIITFYIGTEFTAILSYKI